MTNIEIRLEPWWAGSDPLSFVLVLICSLSMSKLTSIFLILLETDPLNPEIYTPATQNTHTHTLTLKELNSEQRERVKDGVRVQTRVVLLSSKSSELKHPAEYVMSVCCV